MQDTMLRWMIFLIAGCTLASPSLAADKVLSVVAQATGGSTVSGYQGQTVEVDIRVNDAAMVAGAAFTVTFDTANLALTKVSSTFFGTFADQGLPPSAVTFSPLITNPVTTGAMLAAARPENGNGTQVALFTLSFLLKGSPGSYPVSIAPSSISNTSAGYAGAGELIPSLVGVDAGTYPVHTVTVFPPHCTLTIINTDADGDGLPDEWEMDHFGETTTANEQSDYDRDGYSDLQEYTNQVNNDTDPLGAAYDPKMPNAPGGTGYVRYDEDFWILMVPVIINSGGQQ